MKKEIIYTEDYALIVSDVEIKERDWYFDSTDKVALNPIYKRSQDLIEEYYGCKKIIAHRPLKDAPILEGVLLLPDFTQEDSNKELYFQKQVMNPYTTGGQSYTAYEKGFIEGWSKAKETYKYTEEDLKKAFKAGHSGAFVKEHTVPHYDEYMQFLQQPKRPKYFECEMEKVWVRNTDRNAPTLDDFDTIVKTITNSQGQTELVGEFIY